MTYPSPNLKIGTHWLRIGAAPEPWEALLLFQGSEGRFESPSTNTLSVTPGSGIYPQLGLNDPGIRYFISRVTQASIIDSGGATWTQFHSFTLGGQEWDWYLGVVPGGVDFVFQIQADSGPPYSFAMAHWQIFVSGDPTVIPLRYIVATINEPLGQNQSDLHAQSEEGNWSPGLPLEPYDSDEEFETNWPP